MMNFVARSAIAGILGITLSGFIFSSPHVEAGHGWRKRGCSGGGGGFGRRHKARKGYRNGCGGYGNGGFGCNGSVGMACSGGHYGGGYQNLPAPGGCGGQSIYPMNEGGSTPTYGPGGTTGSSDSFAPAPPTPPNGTGGTETYYGPTGGNPGGAAAKGAPGQTPAENPGPDSGPPVQGT